MLKENVILRFSLNDTYEKVELEKNKATALFASNEYFFNPVNIKLSKKESVWSGW